MSVNFGKMKNDYSISSKEIVLMGSFKSNPTYNRQRTSKAYRISCVFTHLFTLNMTYIIVAKLSSAPVTSQESDERGLFKG